MNRSTIKSAIALAVLAASGATFAADGVTLYGLVDAGVRVQNHQPVSGATGLSPNSGNRSGVVSGGLRESRIGFRGTEDLGGGLAAVFQLEAGVNVSNGSTDSALFSRVSHVGLTDGRNSFFLGREYNEAYLSLQEVDPLNFLAPNINPNYQAGALNDTTAFGNTSPSQTGLRTNSAVRYDGNFGAFKGGAQYSFGEVNGDSSANRSYGVRGSYDFGKVLVSGSATRLNNLASNHLDAYTVGAKWRLSEQLALAATYADQSVTGGTFNNTERKVGSIGAFYTPNRVTYGVALYNTRVENVVSNVTATGHQNKAVALASYSLSKRTNVYGTLDYARNNNALVTPTTGQRNVTGATVGLSHSF